MTHQKNLLNANDNEVSKMDLDAKGFWDDSYRVKVAPGLWCDEPVPFVKAAVDRFRSTGAANLLELPCGDGKNTAYLAKHVASLVGADSSPTALAVASKRLAENAITNCALRCADVFATPFLEGEFDAVFCCDLLGHLQNAKMALREIVRVCRPGGTIIGNVFAADDSTKTAEGMTKLSGEEYFYRNQFYFRFYSRSELLKLLDDTGTELIGIDESRWMEGPHEGYREYPHQHASLVFTLRRAGD